MVRRAGVMNTSVDATTRSHAAHPADFRKLRMSSRSCSASSRLVLPRFTLCPAAASRSTSNAAGSGLMPWRKSLSAPRC